MSDHGVALFVGDSRPKTLGLLLLAVSAFTLASSALGASQVGPAGSCSSGWEPTSAQRPGTDHGFVAMEFFDDGSGSDLYVGASVVGAGAHGVARWNGTVWSGLGDGVNGLVSAMGVHDDGTGPALYVAGNFTTAGGAAANRIARWDGTSWSALGGGVDGEVRAIASYDDGSGPALYVGGDFAVAGGTSAAHIARWDGTSWSSLGSGVDAPIEALAVHDDGSGLALFAGGAFLNAGGASATYVAGWNGASWSGLASGFTAAPGKVNALAVHNVGGNPMLFAGGTFFPTPTSQGLMARWNGVAWTNLPQFVHALGAVEALEVSGNHLFAGGNRVSWPGGLLLSSTDGGMNWAPHWSCETPGQTVTALKHGASGLYIGFFYSDVVFNWCSGYGNVNSGKVRHIARYVSFSSVAVVGRGPNKEILALEEFDDGNGSALYAGGTFQTAGGSCSPGAARWNGTSWVSMGFTFVQSPNPSPSIVRALKTFDDGTGNALYAAGNFWLSGGHNVAKRSGASWSAMGGYMGISAHALEVYDDGLGARLYMGGEGGNRIVKWDSGSWSPLGTGVNGTVRAMAVFDDGSGAALFVGGDFTTAGGANADRIAKWDGVNWTALASGLDGAVHTLLVHDDGNGPALFVGGDFTLADGQPASRIARWDGNNWSALAGGVNGQVRALHAYDDGSGPVLHVGGAFTTADGIQAERLARWDGTSWSAVGTGADLSAAVNAFADFDDGTGSALFVGGDFSASPTGGAHLAKWRSCPSVGVAFCFGDGTGNACPCGNSGTAGRGCANSTASGGALLEVTGSASVLAGDLVLVGTGAQPGQPGLYFQGNNAINGGNGIQNGDGLRCAGGNIRRLQIRVAGGAASANPGGSSTTVNIAVAGAVSPGDTRRYQWWYRNPAPGAPCGTNFNLSNGYEVVWVP